MPPDSSSPVGVDPEARRAELSRVDRILYFALLGSHVVYAGLAQFSQLTTAPMLEPGNPIGTVLLVVSLCAAGAALALDTVGFGEAQVDTWIDEAQQKFKQPDEVRTALNQRAMPQSLIRWSMASMASIVGLVTALTGSQPRSTALLLIAVGAFVHLYCQPRMTRVQDRLDERLRGSGSSGI